MWKSLDHPLVPLSPRDLIPRIALSAPKGKSRRTPRNNVVIPERFERSTDHGRVRSENPRSTTIQQWYTGQLTPLILVLALDPYNARLYHDMLEVRGYGAIIAQGQDCWLDALSRCHPDLILLDLCSADHPSIAIAQKILRDPRYKSIPRIAVTDAFKSGDLSDPAMIICECDARIVKPVSIRDFYKPIERVLKASGTGQ